MKKIDKKLLNDILTVASERFIENHKHLLSVNSSERSITHLFATVLREDVRLLKWDIDCEYSRHGDETKLISIENENNSSSELSPKIVYPDIIIHKRASKLVDAFTDNLVVVEAKKNGIDSSYDYKKLKGYLESLNYDYAVMLTFFTDGTNQITWKIWDQSEKELIKPEIDRD